ncbi:MAG: NAD-dependent epimerase/dehydratase family protein [Xanthomonadaceae bacterium]|jgi:nucleoside-diphosphate-sugar epimerase|nr:NAD-dependent epimerase/dehydratase family protein [Xanthomonadaceae bacterium]
MKVLVTGGGGFLGQAICRLLRARGDAVLSVARNHYPALDALGVEQRRVDLTVLDPLLEAARGCDAIVHVAAKPGAWGAYDDYYAANVKATEHVIAACRMHGIPRLVYTSTPSVVHAGGDLEGVDESVPYPAHFRAHYPATKAIAEQRVLTANDATLSTVALRPHLIWGPGDNHLLPRILDRARAGRLRFVGTERKKIDVVYVDNAAQAHLDALDRLAPAAPCAGRAYFISNGEPIFADDMINAMLRACGLPPETRRVPYGLAFAIGAVLEGIYTVFRIDSEPPMTRFVAEQLATAHWYDISAARRDLGYAPRISIDEGLDRLARWYRDQHEA